MEAWRFLRRLVLDGIARKELIQPDEQHLAGVCERPKAVREPARRRQGKARTILLDAGPLSMTAKFFQVSTTTLATRPPLAFDEELALP